MDTVSFLLLVDTSVLHNELSKLILKPSPSPYMQKELGLVIPLGVTVIDLKGDKKLYQRFYDKDLKLNEVPLFIISYQDKIQEYPFNKDTLVSITDKIRELMPPRTLNK